VYLICILSLLTLNNVCRTQWTVETWQRPDPMALEADRDCERAAAGCLCGDRLAVKSNQQIISAGFIVDPLTRGKNPNFLKLTPFLCKYGSQESFCQTERRIINNIDIFIIDP